MTRFFLVRGSVFCADCITGMKLEEKPSELHPDNVFPYKQTCHACKMVLVEPQTAAWPELWPGVLPLEEAIVRHEKMHEIYRDLRDHQGPLGGPGPCYPVRMHFDFIFEVAINTNIQDLAFLKSQVITSTHTMASEPTAEDKSGLPHHNED
jgi:hypothetical protein